MKKQETIWLFLVILFSILHLIRDIFQDLGIHNFLSEVLASPGAPKVSTTIYWTVFNTYVIAVIEIGLALTCLKRNNFGKLGKITIGIAIASIILWFFYYFCI